MKILVLASYDRSLITFRGELLEAMISGGHEVIACAPDFSSDVRRDLEKRHVRCRILKMSRTGMNPLTDIETLASLVKLIRSEQPARILAYTVKVVLYASLAARLVGFSQVYSMITGLGYAFSDGRDLRRRIALVVVQALYRIGKNNVACIFFQNPDDLSVFEDRALIGDQACIQRINGSGVNLSVYAAAPLAQDPRFLLIARLVEEKGIHQYVEAARIVRRSHPEAVFQIAGWMDSNPGAIKAEQLRSWMDEGVIEYLGPLEDVRPALAGCRVFVLPSYYREGTPRTILEAMSMGRPIITTNAPGCRETVVVGVNGLLVDPRDSEALATAMLTLIDSPQLTHAMGVASRRIAEEKYDVHRVNQVILECMNLE